MDRARRRRTDKTTETPLTEPASLTPMPETRNGDVARRAYELYCERGCEHGHDIDDWTRAEQELRAEPRMTD
jgi:hypothetical protein